MQNHIKQFTPQQQDYSNQNLLEYQSELANIIQKFNPTAERKLFNIQTLLFT